MKRIMVVGRSGSGKSVFSDRLSKVTGIPVVHLDKLYYKPDWSLAHTKEVFTSLVDSIIQTDEWIIDGNYSRTMDARAARADVIVFFQLPLLTCVYYACKRAYFPDTLASDKHPDMKEKISGQLFWKMITYPTARVLKRIKQNKAAKVYSVKSHQEIDTLISELGQRSW